MVTAKQSVRELLDQLPEETTYEDIQYRICVRERVERGLREIGERRMRIKKELDLRISK